MHHAVEVAHRLQRVDRQRAGAYHLVDFGAGLVPHTALVQQCVAEAGATSKAQMGAVMKLASAKAAGRADGRALSAEVNKQLG